MHRMIKAKSRLCSSRLHFQGVDSPLCYLCSRPILKLRWFLARIQITRLIGIIITRQILIWLDEIHKPNIRARDCIPHSKGQNLEVSLPNAGNFRFEKCLMSRPLSRHFKAETTLGRKKRMIREIKYVPRLCLIRP
jgi:hypothetical protein